jgi:hypothetical protein
MEKRKLVLYSTTRQYNPGDEFILFGIRNLIKSIGIVESPVIYNRNQEINQPLSFLNPLRRVKSQSKWIKALGSFFRISQVDNSFKDIHKLDIYDMVVFAGSPEWASTRLNPLYRKLQKFDKPILFLGLGSFSQKIVLSDMKKGVIEKAKLVTYRNPESEHAFPDSIDAQLMPCPALFAVEGTQHVVRKGKVAIVFGVSDASKGNHVSQNAMNKMVHIYKILQNKGISVDIVCHYIDEIPYAKEIFKGTEIRYSYDASEYKEIYKDYQYVVTSRVHAVGMCASLGIPGTLIAHDGRASTVKLFKADIVMDTEKEIVFEQNVLDRMERVDELSLELKEHKLNSLQDYQNKLKSALGIE